MLTSKVLLALAAVALAGSVVLASTIHSVHHLRIRLPGGGTERISYIDDTAPKIVILPIAVNAHMFMPTRFGSQFSSLNRISAEINQMKSVIDRQKAVAMWGRETLRITGPSDLTDIALGSIPVSVESYSFVSTSNGTSVCTRQVQITNLGNGTKPKVVSHSSGNCSGGSSTDIPSHDNAHFQQGGRRLPVEIMPPGMHI